MSNEELQAIAVKRYGDPDIPKLGARERDKRCIQIACFVAGFAAGLNERDEWREIGNAPKDGSKIDIWCAYGRVCDVWYSVDDKEWYEGYTSIPEPTHWMPLPQPPNK